MKALIINGPNINMLGIREPDIYGSKTYQQLCDLCIEQGKQIGFDNVDMFQSNHEGEIVDKIQQAYFDHVDAIVINPAAYTHTSIAILDALKAVNIPCIEVHISKVDNRETFRQTSYIRLACIDVISGEGFDGYVRALKQLFEHANPPINLN